MRSAEKRAVERGTSVAALMENAGRAVASTIDRRYGHLPGSNRKRALLVCGLGNNGGDGFVAARYLKKMGWSVLVILLGTPFGIKTAEASENWRRVESSVISVERASELLRSRSYFERSDVIVDAIIGTGAKGGLREPAATAVNMINSSSAVKVSVDIPSGLDPLTGESSGPVVEADLTVALHRAKTGMRGRDEYTGEVEVVSIGIDDG